MTRSSKRSWKKWPARGDRPRFPRAGRLLFRVLLILVAFQAGGDAARGYVRMILGGKVLKWNTPTLSWRLNKTAPPGIEDGSHAAALEHAFQAWEDLPGSKVRFNRKADTSSRNINTSDHILYFDGNNHSGFFPPGGGIVALTPISFDVGTGRILDADILFNSRDFDFATDGSPGRYDLQDVASHEIGHFIGLDHSPLVSSTLWPFVAPRQWLHRSLSADDAAGGTAVMSNGLDSSLSGRLFKSDASVLKGGLVVAVHAEDGRVAGSALSDKNGNWSLRGLSAGNFFVYAAPVEGNFQQENLTGETPLQNDFGVTFYGGFSNPAVHPLGASSHLDCGSLAARPDSPLLESASTPLLIHPGESRPLTLSGAGFPPGGLSLVELSPGITLSGVSNGANWVQATVTVSPSCPLGAYDLYLTTASGDLEAASGVVEVVAPAPLLSGVDPPIGSVNGGTTVRLTGSGFQPGGWVLFGGVEASSVVFLDENNLEVVAPANDPGTLDVAVNNPDGQQARAPAAFTFASVPVFTELFPAAGQSAGGTTVLLNGSGFDPGMTVTIGGTPAAATWVSSKLVRLTTPGHAAGSADVTLANPLGAPVTLPNAFRYVAASDPVIFDMTPTRGSRGGGASVQISGSNFGGHPAVVFGADPQTGRGGRPASQVTALGPGEIRTVTPAFANGSFAVLVINEDGQGVVAPGTFTFLGETASSGGGAGGCGGVIGAAGPRDPVGDLPAWVLLFGSYWFIGRRSRRRRIPGLSG